MTLSAVMAGPVPAIHVLTPEQDVDVRDKRGHDESNIAQFGIRRAFVCVAKCGKRLRISLASGQLVVHRLMSQIARQRNP